VPDGPLTGDPDRDQIGIVAIGVTTTTFEVLGLPLVSGRGFTEAEIRDPDAPVAIASRALAARFFPGREAVGGRVGIVNGATTTWLTIAGVVADAQFEEFGEETPQSKLALWLPFASLGNRSFAVLMKSSGDPAPLLPQARGAVRAFDAAIPLWDLRTYDDIRALTSWEQCSRLLRLRARGCSPRSGSSGQRLGGRPLSSRCASRSERSLATSSSSWDGTAYGSWRSAAARASRSRSSSTA
jgi:hypothetical protein